MTRPLPIQRLYRLLEKEGYRYVIRIKANAVLEREIEHLLTRPVGRPSHKPKVFYHSFQYQAKSWQHSRRVVAKVEWHAGELFPRIGFIVTNLNMHSKNVVKFYNGRGTAEQWIKEGKNAVKWTKLSCRTFKDNQTRLQLFALAYNLANFLRRLALPRDVKHWSLTTLTREADQDWGQGDAALEVRDVPTGRGGGDAELVRGDPHPHCAVGDSAAGRGVSRLSVSGRQKCDKLRGESAPTRRPALQYEPNGPFAGPRDQPRRARAEKMRKIFHALDTGGGRDVRIGSEIRLEWFQAQPKWEIPE